MWVRTTFGKLINMDGILAIWKAGDGDKDGEIIARPYEGLSDFSLWKGKAEDQDHMFDELWKILYGNDGLDFQAADPEAAKE